MEPTDPQASGGKLEIIKETAENDKAKAYKNKEIQANNEHLSEKTDARKSNNKIGKEKFDSMQTLKLTPKEGLNERGDQLMEKDVLNAKAFLMSCSTFSNLSL